jgi:predicted TPR repeat methyltransferase
MQESHRRVQWVYSSTSNDELEERYDQWASDYDKDLAEEFAWNAPQTASEVFHRHVAQGAKVLDAGAGTGLVGECLSQMGYEDIDAMDLSLGMLEQAQTKGLYRQLHQMVLGEDLEFDSQTFDAVISVGVFTLGHAPPHSFNELVRITKPSGFIVFSLRTDVYEENGFKEQQQALETAEKWKLVEVTDPFQPLPKGEPEVYHQIWAYQVR